MKHASLLVLLVLAFAVSAQAGGQKPKNRIVGGVEAAPGEFPFIISLRKNGSHFCGGSLIAKNWVLTAAHCVIDQTPSRLQVVVGLHKQSDANTDLVERHAVKTAIVHPEYGIRTRYDSDYALLELATDSAYAPVALQETRIDIPESEADSPISTTAGWGTTREGGSISRVLMKVDVPFVSETRCDDAYPGDITDRMICAGLAAGGKDSCQGDSGGPLLAKGDDGVARLAGVVSWGHGCARPGKYGVYSNPTPVLGWIAKSTGARRRN